MRILDRYLLSAVVASMAFALLALSLVFIVVNLIESLDRFLDQHADAWTIALYYLYFLPEIIKLLLPVTVLVAILFAIGKLTDAYETTAMKSAGMSLYRLLAPIILLCTVIAAGHLYFNGWVVPRVLTKKFAIERQYLGRNTGGVEQQLYNLYLRDTPRRIVALGYYDLRNNRGKDLSVEEYSDGVLPHLVRRIDARAFRWDSSSQRWIAEECFVRTFSAGSVNISYYPVLPVTLATDDARLSTLQRSMDEMTFPEQADYIAFLRRGGRNTRQLDIAHAGDYAFPVASIIVALIAVPFASVKKRSGLAANIAAAMTMTFCYLVLTKITQALGMDTALPPTLVGWSANIIFAVVAAIVLLRTPT
ncbi:MAG: YjgP/YjgQ family permease [Chlorobiota bacterium]|jgi:lipopolysaccharide export system permease protein|nr:MAG: YjgP/YjgQ family permease [Chlorobiota bacterium]